MEDTFDKLPNEVTNPHEARETITIPVVKEHLTVSTRETITGEVQVQKTVHTEQLDVPLDTIFTTYREHRVPVDRVVDTMPRIRYEGENLIVPVVREEEVVTKRLVLVEEIHLIRESHTEQHTEHIELRTEEATITRASPPTAPTQPTG